jgi:hypothetical protein
MKNAKIEACLRQIATKHGGMLKPEHIIKEAESPKHPLHSRFEWDDTEAAYQHRLWQARQLISVCVEVIGDFDPSPVFVSLSSDRGSGAGYRVMANVMSDAEMRAQLLKDALHEANRWAQKYHKLKQLAGVFAALKKVKKAA